MIRLAEEGDILKVAEMANQLFLGSTLEELYREFSNMLGSEESHLLVYYLGEEVIGFANCELRIDYVEGSETSPVMFLEGIYIHHDHRGKGYGRELVKYAEDIGRQLGLYEFASDCEIEDKSSYDFHIRSGFQEVGRTISFIKKLWFIYE